MACAHKTMNEHTQRSKLAELDGYNFKLGYLCKDNFRLHHVGTLWEGWNIINIDLVPDYLNDLDAIRDLENKLTDTQWSIYTDELITITLGPVRMVSQIRRALVSASAAQKAQALLRIHNLWEEKDE